MPGSMPERCSPASCSLEVACPLILLLCHTAADLHILCVGWQPCLRRPPSLGCWSTRPAPREVEWAHFWRQRRSAAASNPRTRAQSALSLASICPLMSAFECSQVAWCVLQPPYRVQPVGPRSEPSAARIGRQREHVWRQVGGLARDFMVCSGQAPGRACGG